MKPKTLHLAWAITFSIDPPMNSMRPIGLINPLHSRRHSVPKENRETRVFSSNLIRQLLSTR